MHDCTVNRAVERMCTPANGELTLGGARRRLGDIAAATCSNRESSRGIVEGYVVGNARIVCPCHRCVDRYRQRGRPGGGYKAR